MAYLLGQAVRIATGTISGPSGATDPATLTLTITKPDASTSTFVIGDMTRDSLGNYHYDYLPSLAGEYAWRFVATVPNAAAEGEFDVDAPGSFYDTSGWQPTPTDVAGLLAQRTVDATGVPTGTFSATSSPSSSQVSVLIQDIAGEVSASAGPIPEILFDDARLVTVLGTAALIETSFSDGSDALANMLATRYQNALARLTTAVSEINDSGQVFPEGVPPSPLFAFPDVTCLDYTTVRTVW